MATRASFWKKTISNKIKDFAKNPNFGPEKMAVYLKLPYIGKIFQKYKTQISSTLTNCFGHSILPRIIFYTKSLMPSINKDPLPTVRKNMVIYKFHGCCDAVYVGRTSLTLEDRITQHISATNQKSITKKPTRTQPHRPCKQKYQKEPKSENTQITPTAPTTAIAKHLLNNPECLTKFNKNLFSILAQARSKYHLSILESIFINSMKPSLCVQKTTSVSWDYSLRDFLVTVMVRRWRMWWHPLPGVGGLCKKVLTSKPGTHQVSWGPCHKPLFLPIYQL